ncbi:MAG: PfkB family carbohydrate kinase [Chloroflexota bacterium]
MNNHLPNYLIIGHVTKDNIPGGAILGGTPSYAGMTARHLGQRTAIVTSYGPDIPSLAVLEGIEIKRVPHAHSTTFQNTYLDGVRYQKWLTTGGTLTYEEVPPAWRNASIVHLSPMAQELSPRLCSRFPHSLVCVTIQGWLRGRDPDDNVIFQPHPDLHNSLGCIDILVLSLADVGGDRAAADHILTSVKIGVETLGPDGCRVFHNGAVFHMPVRPEPEVDPTGAGDIFAAAFFVRYRDTKDIVKAAQFANACGSLSVRKLGLAGVPTLPEVETHLLELYGEQALAVSPVRRENNEVDDL